MRPSYLTRLLLATFLFAQIGVAAELLLIGHFEDFRQLIPLILIGVTLGVTGWTVSAGAGAGAGTETGAGRAAAWAFRACLVLMAVSGLVGQFLHLRGNMEFEIERDASLRGWALLWESLGGATPALAPGTMVLIALIGFAYGVSRASGRGPSNVTPTM